MKISAYEIFIPKESQFDITDKEKYVLNLKKKVENPDYQKRVKEDVQKEDKDKLTKAETEIVKIKESIEKLHKLKK